jgi:RNA polymerase sigma-70 factor (ECF subfamily)
MSGSKETEGSSGRRRFATTEWSLIVAAGDSQSPERDQALATLCRLYWYPVYAYTRRRGHGADQAQDLTQTFFCALLEKNYVKTADPDRGRFRSFLLASVKHFLADEHDRATAQKRGGGVRPLELDASTAESRYQAHASHDDTPERMFEKRWASSLLERTLETLRVEMSRAGSAERFERLSPFLTEATPGARYGDVARLLGITEDAVKSAVHRMRRRFGELVREEVVRTVDTAEMVDQEVRYLFGVLRS